MKMIYQNKTNEIERKIHLGICVHIIITVVFIKMFIHSISFDEKYNWYQDSLRELFTNIFYV